MDLPSAISRRQFLKTAAAAAAFGGLAGTGILPPHKPAPAAAATAEKPLVWVWKFSVDGPLGPILDTLLYHGLGVILKTHDGTSWMRRYDPAPDAITGPGQVAHLARVFEERGIPFHAWCVVQGKDPSAEAYMCNEVLNAGARSIFLDLEPKEGNNYWQGTPDSALRFGEELRWLNPNANILTAPDARPWQMAAVPLSEFLSFSNAVAPQSYWVTFNSPTNLKYLRQHGYPVGPEGFTPELMVDVSIGTFQYFGLPVYPIGQGAAPPDHWHRFVAAANARGLQPLSMWRFGTADPGALGVLQRSIPLPPPEPEPEPLVQAQPDPATEPAPERAAQTAQQQFGGHVREDDVIGMSVEQHPLMASVETPPQEVTMSVRIAPPQPARQRERFWSVPNKRRVPNRLDPLPATRLRDLLKGLLGQ
jgi:hypothetical protein